MAWRRVGELNPCLPADNGTSCHWTNAASIEFWQAVKESNPPQQVLETRLRPAPDLQVLKWLHEKDSNLHLSV